MSEFTLLSYNLWFHKAFPELPELIREHDVDVLCLQECEVEGIRQNIGELSLVRADTLIKNIGLVTYINRDRWQVKDNRCDSLPDTSYEKLTRKTARPRLQLLKLEAKDGSGEIAVGNVHIANLMSGSKGRRLQAARATQLMAAFAGTSPAVLAGDFNYPFRENGLLSVIEPTGFTSVHHNKPTYYRWPRRPFDRMFIKNLTTEAFEVLPFGVSDHAPIVGRFTRV